MNIQKSDSAKGYADLVPLKKMTAHTRVVALGEPAHGFTEPLAFRNRLFAYLVEHCGFSTIILEAGLAESRPAIDYISEGKGSAEAAAAMLTIGGPSPETIALLKWMRRYNSDPSHQTKLQFYGMDMQIRGLPGDTIPAHAALTEALTYLQKADTALYAKFRRELKPFLSLLSVAKYPAMDSTQHDRLSALLDDLVAAFAAQQITYTARTSAKSFAWAYRNAIVARQTDRMVRVMPPDKPGSIPPEAWKVMNGRDAAMAENVLWVLGQMPGSKALVFAHNAHVKNAPTTGSVWDAFAVPPNALGQYLKAALGDQLLTIGSSIGPSKTNAQPGSLDLALIQVGKPRFLLDLRNAKALPKVNQWLMATRPMEANTGTFLKLSTAAAFDALLYMDKTQ